MRQAALHYFSGTGNTLRAAELAGAVLRRSGFETELLDMASAASPKNCSGLHVFLFPTYGFTTPHLAQKYLRQLPRPEPGAKAAVIATIGTFSADAQGFEGNSLYTAARLLSKRGWDVFFTGAASYPANWTQFTNPPPPKTCLEIYSVADEKVRGMAAKIAAGERSFRTISAPMDFYTRSANVLFLYLGRLQLSKFFVADSDCNACGLCAEKCPVKAIKMSKGRPLWSYKCEVCQRCINSCPRNAIQTSIWRVAGALNLLFLPYIRWYESVAGATYNWAAKALAFAVGYAAAFVLFDKIFAFLETTPGLNSLTGLSFSKNFRRYLSPAAPSQKD